MRGDKKLIFRSWQHAMNAVEKEFLSSTKITQQEIAKRLNLTESVTSELLSIIEHSTNKEVIQATSRRQAYNVVLRIRKEERDFELGKIVQGVSNDEEF